MADPIIVNNISPEKLKIKISINNAETRVAMPTSPVKNTRELLWFFNPTVSAKILIGTTINRRI
tara:strand:+ start:410 stop:601 length:192 start_codon:yes stop_codon:yes gene_type:complete